jgi:glycosyltransferase involved in cell wall biosynthesis
LGDRIKMLGFIRQASLVVTAADALVHPTHYDAYGLSVQEALCCGLPAIVTATAGVAERYPEHLTKLLLAHPPRPQQIVDILRAWRADVAGYSAAVAPFAAALRQRSWSDMARDIVELTIPAKSATEAVYQ